ncbi:NADH-quinone oxidoreductase subunit C [Streptomyces genisteinicus]|uniref:NADH-quinone oxidoreductase subunit C n=1 Tax=Streptomyces genisteinicus TaxID=2768068 RepID=A0A7H0HVZ5_9ACTN|nr:NADH-quinone oxidoreductase subunit C [Streptomyces genisteinicus]QNP64711.1 NADH-quinone oxidoreductase subunit C [Streptomyces genisteinicus]
MNAYDRLPDAVTEIFGPDATAERSYELLTVDVPSGSWTAALETARDSLGCTWFDWLSAVDEPGTGFRVCAHVVALADGAVRRLLVRTTVPHEAAALPTAVGVYAGASWHERETHEMFGIGFTGHPHLDPLLLPDGFEGHPLRKDFVLAARVAKAWPGAKEPGEPAAGHDGPKRRQMLPPGVPDPNEWGPLKGQLPPAPARPARTPRAAAAPGAGTPAPAERPPRRARSASEGSASQPSAAAPRRSRSASEGSASQATPAVPPATPRRSRSASEGSASQATPAAPASPEPGSASGGRTRSSDAPWHHARPAFDEPSAGTAPPTPVPQAPAPGDEPQPSGAEDTPAEGDAPTAPEPAPPAGATPAVGATPAEREPEPAPSAEGTPAGDPAPDPAPPAEGTPAEATPTPEPDPDAGGTPRRPAGGDPA